MSKVICDVCGTSYPDTAAQCPICGCVRTAGKQSVAGDTAQQEQQEQVRREAVKGGRYSKANVRKRSKAAAAPVTGGKKPPQKKDNTDKGLVITAWVLVAAIVIVLGYVAIRYFVPNMGKGSGKDTTGSVGESTTQATDDTTQAIQEHKSCVGLTLSASSVVLDAEGSALLLNVIADPVDTDDEIIYTSSDESVATVTSEGRIMAIAPGQAVITVTCGNVQAACAVTCDFETETDPSETTAPEETTTPEQTQNNDTLELNREDITLAYKGEKWQLYSGSLAKSQITWSTDDASVATIDNGEVVAVGSGTTTVYAEYNGQKVSCIIRCSFDDETEAGSEGGEVSTTTAPGEDGGFNTGIGEDGGGEFDDSLAVG